MHTKQHHRLRQLPGFLQESCHSMLCAPHGQHPLSAAQVLEAVDRLTGDRVALKRIFISQPEAGLPCNVFREYKCLQRVAHDNVVRILDVYPSVRSDIDYISK